MIRKDLGIKEFTSRLHPIQMKKIITNLQQVSIQIVALIYLKGGSIKKSQEYNHKDRLNHRPGVMRQQISQVSIHAKSTKNFLDSTRT